MILEVKKFFVCENREAVFQIEYDKRDHDFITRRPWSIIRGYACTKDGGTPRSMHRLIMKVDDHRIIHHLDGNKLNNRRSNLVICNSAKEHKAYHKKQLGGSEMNCKCSKCGHEWIKRTESDPKMCPSCKSRLWKSRTNGKKGGRPKLEPYSIEWKHARKAWVQDHHNEKWGKFWKVHYIMADTEYSAGEFLTKKEALDELKKTKANLK